MYCFLLKDGLARVDYIWKGGIIGSSEETWKAIGGNLGTQIEF